ncbi:MAG: biotin synthase BioB [Paludibacteraceae bacterium]|nr:biotin synthase BioB [Paludibacteraceae bacterium]MBN2788029.1 biotin synthase BioB [Paludibacteraceae bacterium]
MTNIQELKEKVIKGYQMTFEEGVALTQIKDKEALYKAADEIRLHFCGNKMDLCSITNAKSGRCSEDCKWCSQSSHYKTDIEEYEIVDKDEAVKVAIDGAKKGVKRHSLVTSGRTVSDKTIDQLIPIYQEIKAQSTINLCASLGLVNQAQLQRLKNEVNIEHYHCNLETAPSHFPKLCSTHTIEEKLKTISYARNIGLKICSGGIIGMGESMEQRVEFAIALRDIQADSIPINILSPVKGTPLEDTKLLSEEDILTTIAMFRFINPKANIRFAGGRLQIKHFQHKALHAGINAALTGDYLTTIGSNTDEDVRDFKNSGFEID